jgi:glycosyltransferase involved in cell wall biosynthesis
MAPLETEQGVSHVRLPGYAHTRRLALNLVLDFLWGIRVTRSLPPGEVVICNTIALPVWLKAVKSSAGKVAVVLGRAPKGQVRFYRGVARIYSPSSYVAAQISERWAAVRTRVIGNPIDWHLLAGHSSQSGGPVTIGFAGRLHPEKGLAMLVRASCLLARREGLPDWRLKIIGPSSVAGGGGGDEWVNGLKKEASSGAGNRVEWLAPEFDPKRLAQAYGTMDIFCYPSLAEKGETFGVSIAEAMAARCACVVSSLGCFSDLVTDGQTGLIFDHTKNNSDALLADSLSRLITDSALRKDLALKGQQHALRFDYSEVSSNILEDLAVLTGAPAKKQG